MTTRGGPDHGGAPPLPEHRPIELHVGIGRVGARHPQHRGVLAELERGLTVPGLGVVLRLDAQGLGHFQRAEGHLHPYSAYPQRQRVGPQPVADVGGVEVRVGVKVDDGLLSMRPVPARQTHQPARVGDPGVALERDDQEPLDLQP